MVDIPKITWREEYQSGVNRMLSFVHPYDECTVIFSCNVHIKQFYCRVTYENEEWGIGIGHLVAEFNNRPSNTPLSFVINANRDLLNGDGTYRVGLYVQNDDDVWNVEQNFITVDNKQLQTKEVEDFYVSAEKPLTTLTISINASTTIDLSQLQGLNLKRINWGDGVVTRKGSTHTYATGGTFTIQANFQDIVSINDYFMYQNTTLTSINMNDFENLIKIGSSCFSGCTSLTSFTCDYLTQVTNLGNNFLLNCVQLSSFNFSKLCGLSKPPAGLLTGCSSITNVDLSSLLWSDLGDNFLTGFTGLTSLDLSRNTNITKIGNNFLQNCSNLTTLYVPLKSTPPTLGSIGAINLNKIVAGAYVNNYATQTAGAWFNYKDIIKES